MCLYSLFDAIFSKILIKITLIELDFLIENGYLDTFLGVVDVFSYIIFFFIFMLYLTGLLSYSLFFVIYYLDWMINDYYFWVRLVLDC